MEILNEDWTADVVGRMHKYRISNIQLAEECRNPYGKTGYSPAYLSCVLNGRKEFETEYAKENTKRVILAALDRLIEKAEKENCDAAE